MYKFSILKKNASEPFGAIRNIEVTDEYFGGSLGALSAAAVADIGDALVRSLSRIVLYTAQSGITTLEDCERIFVNARTLHIENISFAVKTYVPMPLLIRLAQACGIRLLFETDGDFDFDAYARFACDSTGIIYNPQNYARAGKKPFLGVLYKNRFKSDIVLLRINDGVLGGSEECMPEHGNSEVKECVSTLLARSFDGYFSLPSEESVPYLQKLLCEL